MADWSTIEGCRNKTEGLDAANSRGITITASATANTKGSWTQLAASTGQACDVLTIITVRPGTASADYLIDIGVGTAGSEQVIISDLLICSPSGGATPMGVEFVFPISIPAGTRIAARCQATTLSSQIRISYEMAQLPMLASAERSIVKTYGDATADSGGTSIDPGGTANTKGAWTQIVASTTYAASALLIGFGDQVNTVRTDCTWLVDVGVGSAGSEKVVVPDFLLQAEAASDDITPGVSPPLPVSIPAATPISVRAQCSITDATDRLFDAVLYVVS
jgi:hypothetical protein